MTMTPLDKKVLIIVAVVVLVVALAAGIALPALAKYKSEHEAPTEWIGR